ncbi:MAG: hypothetical protein IJR82_04395 [Bacilli bacterium]|nr:hypothetical protein [Bacilli bacterium]
MPNYDDIISLPHHVSKKYQPMSILNRAGQFAPFAALTGFGEAINEVSRITDSKKYLNDYDELNYQLQFLKKQIKNKPCIMITYFVSDKTKNGGKYIKEQKNVKIIDEVYNKIIFTDKSYVDFGDILKIDIVNI